MNNHTYFHRAKDFFLALGFAKEANECMIKYEEIRKERNL